MWLAGTVRNTIASNRRPCTKSIGHSSRLPVLIPSFGYADKQNAAKRVGKHTDVEKELPSASIVVLVQRALVFQLQVLFKTGFEKPANIDLANVAKWSDFPKHGSL